jgi:hypothetical protein
MKLLAELISLGDLGYSYCHSCTDFQALMPRGGYDAGYDSMNVCGFCIDFLNSRSIVVSLARN